MVGSESSRPVRSAVGRAPSPERRSRFTVARHGCDNARMTARFQVSDLLAHPGTARSESGAVPVSVSFTNAGIDDMVEFEVDVRSLSDGVVVRGHARSTADLTCTRCLTTWSQTAEVPIEAVFRRHPDEDGDELPIDSGGWIDLGSVVHDEATLGLPERPLCKEDCLGLCPTCGTDLNVEPCEGHGDTIESPFAALRQLLAEESPQKPES